MWVFGLLCVLSVAAALPAPQSSEAEDDNGAYIPEPEEVKRDISEEKKEVYINPIMTIPGPPQLGPIVPVFIEIDGAKFEIKKSEDKEEKESGEENKEEGDKKPEEEKPGVITLDISKPPTFWNNLISHVMPFQMSQFNFPSFNWGTFWGGPGRTGLVYPDNYPLIPDYRYVYMK